MDIILFHSIWTVLLLVLFIGIWAWAWSNKRKDVFDAAARLPLEDDDIQGCISVAAGRTPRATDDMNLPTHRGDKNHG